MTDFIDKGLIFDAPDNFQIISMGYGHLAHIELLFLWERNQPDWGDIPMQVMARSHETEIRHGHHATMPPRSMPMLEKLGPLYSDCHVWSTKIAEAFGAQSNKHSSRRRKYRRKSGDMSGRFTNKVVLVTGGTSGLGRDAALAFAREDANVVLTGRRVEAGEEVVSAIRKEGGEEPSFVPMSATPPMWKNPFKPV